MKNYFLHGMHHGVPIALGYLSVSFGFGILASKAGLSVWDAAMISITNLTSAGQAAGVQIIKQHGTIFEMIITQLVINIRYSLMSLSLSQKLDKSFSFPKRLLASYGITDEIFAVSSVQDGKLKASYMYGMILISFLGWTVGTILGASAGELLPKAVSDAMGIVLYGMFIAIIIPPSRKNKKILFVVLTAAVLSILCTAFFKFISAGFSIIICSVLASILGAVIFPVDDEEEEETA